MNESSKKSSQVSCKMITIMMVITFFSENNDNGNSGDDQ